MGATVSGPRRVVNSSVISHGASRTEVRLGWQRSQLSTKRTALRNNRIGQAASLCGLFAGAEINGLVFCSSSSWQ